MKSSSTTRLTRFARRQVGWIQACAFVAALFPAVVSAAEPNALLADMARAIETLNYKGTLVYMQPGQADAFRVYHRVTGDETSEKVVDLGGDGAEVIRTPAELICVFPGQRKVIVDQRSGTDGSPSPLRASLPEYTPDLAGNYGLQLLGQDRVANRSVNVVAIEPADEYRYGYRLWLDDESSMPLKMQLLHGDNALPVEELFFTAISMPTVLEEELIQPSVEAQDYEWVRRGEAATLPKGIPFEDLRWHADKVPAGFIKTVATREYISESEAPRTHIVYSDGLASVSVFVDLGVAASEQVEGLTTLGATNAYSLMIDGFLVTAMGEVPAPTVQMIATSMELLPDPAVPAP